MPLKLKENITTFVHTEEEIQTELQRVLSSELFSRSSVLSSFLKFIVEETLAGKTEELKEYTIAVKALVKPKDFNPQIDAIVRIHAGRLRRLLNEYYNSVDNTSAIKIELEKGTYVPVFLNQLISEPVAITQDTKPALNFSRSKLTIGVLPFRNLCPENEYQFFVDGFGEELTRMFSAFQNIAVVAHHSTRKYATNLEDIRVIGTELGTHYLICGSVKRSVENIRVSVSLIETVNGMQIWSETYNHKLNSDNFTSIQDEIIESVSAILGGHFGLLFRENYKAQGKSISNLENFDAALWNYHFHMNYSLETYKQTRNALTKAIEKDPNFALGIAMLSEIMLDAYTLGFPIVEDPINEAYKLAKKAIKIDPQCQHACQQYGWSSLYMKKKEQAITAFEHCLALNPSSVSTMGAIGFAMACAGEYKRGYALLTKSIKLNPHCPFWFHLGFFLIYFNDKHYEKALIYANNIDVLDVFMDPLSKAVVKMELGLKKEAIADLNTLNEKFPEIINNLNIHLDSFLLDTKLIDNLIKSVEKIKALSV